MQVFAKIRALEDGCLPKKLINRTLKSKIKFCCETYFGPVIDNDYVLSLMERYKTRSMKRAKTESKSRSKEQDKELSSVLFSAGYRIKYMVGDGNCLFRSLADQLRYNKIVAVTM